ncbi:hypothetical protein CAP35_11150 [Chitinophagaceae bacterium IBVUCB1]|jgi:uncharacterized protein YkwD|nr:hypothetical protein CAP35_11150 [Chitinophagaceae bacterium IBVUCB1]
MVKGIKYKQSGIVWVVSVLLFALLPISLQADALRRGERQIEKDIFRLVNEYREEQGLPALAYNDVLATVAQGHSSDMASGKVAFGHGGFKGRFDAIKQQVSGIRSGAENVAYGAEDAEQVVALWLRSAGHKKNIVGDFTHTGISVVSNDDGTLYFTQLFAKIE